MKLLIQEMVWLAKCQQVHLKVAGKLDFGNLIVKKNYTKRLT